jgi:pimeloyl-ACP methyl ester carboxylesterase
MKGKPESLRVRTPHLDIACQAWGPSDGAVALLLHGFPYDVHAYDEVAPILAEAGLRVIVPWLRGFGGTRLLAPQAQRSGQQAAVGHDARDLLDALGIGRALVAGYDWGGRAACVLAALWPQRVSGLVTAGGYAIQDIPGAAQPLTPQAEHRLWYQYYFHGERGRAGLAANRRALCKLLWQQWSPEWRFDDATYNQSADAFDNPDFVDVVIHSYRHRFGLVAGDPAFEDSEARLRQTPAITVPTVAVFGGASGFHPSVEALSHPRFFSGPIRREVMPGAGHNVPQEAPEAFAQAVLSLRD